MTLTSQRPAPPPPPSGDVCTCGHSADSHSGTGADAGKGECRVGRCKCCRWVDRRKKLDPRPLLKPAVLFLVIALVAYGTAWAVANCWGYTVTHNTRVADKRHDVDYWTHCHWRDEDTGVCYDSHTHVDHDYTLVLEDGKWEYVYEGKYNAYKVGDNYTYETHHVACK